jgi:uncharacterized repeat protein (TIGR01451 family)
MAATKFFLLLVLLTWMTSAAIAQTNITPTTTTTQLSIAAGPLGGIVLPGTHINPSTGRPERHLWYGDGGAGGFCRVDPDLDSTGTHSLNSASCLLLLNNISVSAGPAAYDPATGNIYFVDESRNSQGVFVLQYDPAGDNGRGMLSGGTELAGNPTGGKASGNPGCLFPGNPAPLTPDALALGPDGNLWVGFAKGAQILRIKNPANFDGNCANSIEIVALAPDGRTTAGLAWIGHDLYGADGNSPFIIPNADTTCTPTCTPISILPQIAGVTVVLSDQNYPSVSGNNLYFGTGVDVEWLGNVTDLANQTLAVAYGGNAFLNVGGLALDADDPANLTLLVGDDPAGLGTGGEWYRVIQTADTPAAPGTPANVSASSKFPNQATVVWAPAQTGQPVDSYTVHNSFASDGILHADVIVGQGVGIKGAATSVVVTGLTNDVSYRFTVSANNTFGSSASSAESNTVTPVAFTVPTAPTNAFAIAGDAGAGVSWTAPASDGGQPITSYTVQALIGGLPTGITATIPAPATSLFISGLTNGTTYTFNVYATNAVGNSAESAQSNAVTPAVGALAPDISITMSGPATGSFGTQASYTATVRNNGPSPAAQVVVSDSLVGAGASILAAVPGQGSCTVSATSSTCNLGSMASGSTTTIVYIVLLGNAGVTNQASVLAKDAGGITFTDPTPANNTASVTTTVDNSGVTATTTDLQVSGSASNGGPPVNTAINYTWQIKDNQSIVANNVLFTNTLPASLQFNSVTSTLGSCTGPAVGSLGGTITCTVAKLGGPAQGGVKPVNQFNVTVNVTVRQTGVISNTGSVSFFGTDTNPANNSVTVNINAR